ncbi:Small glutamine-rich tetratricopeptide repeat-containing protein 2 [Erysiphe neolycopersici]|uniref:Small glutamine-rich tetratricopeptide repeat-containing protein 2 n=1 Tax=Erysiphe neolycopersici TaxID=212602 RepID=A0A420HG64_9PEZI|nr:Small glutamine-rich tetratricopeptide repeat-containing protein 2 [Erysiphe neolycopersici]
MASIKQRIALSIIDFLDKSLSDGTLKEEDRESVEIATNCISDIFEVNAAQKEAGEPRSLLQIYSLLDKIAESQQPLDSTTTATLLSSILPGLGSKKESTGISEDQKKQAEDFKSQGNALMAKKDYVTAIELYTKALEIMPKNPIFLSNRAAAYSALKDYKSACSDAEAAVDFDPSFTKAWSRLGLARFALGDHKGSMEAYGKGIEYEGNGGSDAMKKGFETASKRVAEQESTGDSNKDLSNSGHDTSGVGSGGMPDLSALAGMFGGGGAGGAGGGFDLNSLMNNPMFAKMSKNLMSNPNLLSNLMNNPRVAEMLGQNSGSGGDRAGASMPDLSRLMQDPNIAELQKLTESSASKFLGGAGRGNGQ